uniref:Uncharacterized protein n=1 Tax=Arundo donax TaxID=35708 RepID=A0A0A9HG96_ARUDO
MSAKFHPRPHEFLLHLTRTRSVAISSG